MAKLEKHTWAAKYPTLGTGPISAEGCVSDEIFEKEREKIFKRTWLHVGRVEEIPKPGDYFTKRIDIWKSSIVVVRGEDNEIRAFHNMCTHRVNKLLWDECGKTKNITCSFHGWVFDLKGKNKSIPDQEDFFPGIEKTDLNLLSVSLEVWNGFIFVNYQNNPEESLTQFLAEVGTGLASYPFQDFKECYILKGVVDTNWKVLMDSFQEGYHLYLHRFSSARHAMSPESDAFRGLGYRLYDRHRQGSIGFNPDRDRLGVESIVEKCSGGTTIWADSRDASLSPEYLNVSKARNWAFDITMLFPNFDLFITRNGWYLTHTFLPIAPGKTYWEYRQYYPMANTPSERFAQEYAWIQRRDVQSEDISTTVFTQEMLFSGLRRFFLAKDDEVMVRHSHEVIQREINK